MNVKCSHLNELLTLWGQIKDHNINVKPTMMHFICQSLATQSFNLNTYFVTSKPFPLIYFPRHCCRQWLLGFLSTAKCEKKTTKFIFWNEAEVIDTYPGRQIVDRITCFDTGKTFLFETERTSLAFQFV